MKSIAINYVKFSRLFGCFPVQEHVGSKNGNISFNWCSLPVAFSIFLAIAHTLTLSEYVHFSWSSKLLAFVITVLPSGLGVIFTDNLIRISSMCNSKDLINLFGLLTRNELSPNLKNGLRCFGLGSLLFVACAFMRLIGFGLVYPQIGASATAFKTGTSWDRIVAIWTTSCDFSHDGNLLSALSFCVIFGLGLVASLEGFYKEVQQYLKTFENNKKGVQSLTILAMDLDPLKEFTDGLVRRFLELKLAFKIYSKMAGIFVFALAIDSGTLLFLSASTVLFQGVSINDYSPEKYLVRVVATFQLITAMLNLFFVAELGHQMANQVHVKHE